MELRRRRSPRRSAAYAARSPRRTAGGRSSYGAQSSAWENFIFTVLLLLVAAAVIYLIAATPVGSQLIKKILPERTGTPSPASTAIPEERPTESPSGESSTANMEFKEIDMYALQLGVYDSPSAAHGLISSLRTLGAAGYSLNTDEGLRILASCYTTEAAAESVLEKIEAKGYSCTVYPLQCRAVELDVTASGDRIEALKNAVDLCYSVIEELNEEVLRFDTEERSVEYGVAVVNEILLDLRTARSEIEGISDAHGVAELIDDYLMKLTGDARTLVSSQSVSRVEFSGMLKALQISAIEKYIALLDALRALGD